MSKLDFNKFRPLLGDSWAPKLEPFFRSGKADKIYDFLKQESAKGKKIAPVSSNVYRAFLETPLEELRVVFLGICPYHTYKYGTPIADGLMMSCENNKPGELQPSLDAFYRAIEQDIAKGLNLNMDKPNSLLYLAKQGILLGNIALTVEENKALSHNHIWEPFTNFLIEEVLNPYTKGLIYVLMGKEAHKFKNKILPFSNYVFCLEHPAASSYRGDGVWQHDNIFSKINEILESNNGLKINWIDESCPF